MNINQLLQSCFRSIFRNRMRSILTSLGIIIGVGSVIIMLAIGEGSQNEIEKQISAMGTNVIQIMSQRTMARGQGNAIMVRPVQLTLSDAEKLKTESSYALAVSGVTQVNATISGPQGSASIQVLGVDPDYLTIKDWKVEEGTYFDEEDMLNRNRVAVLGVTSAESLFGSAAEALGQQFRIGTDYFTVIGILDKKGVQSGGQDQDDTIHIPLHTALYRLNNSTNISTINMSVVNQKYMEAAQREAELILREAHKLPDGTASDFQIMNSSELIDMASETSRSLTVLLAAIAGVSLLVGGIGIMNIMLVSVTERTREIGVRMSVGARKRDILFQFLSESVILSLMGGITGIATAALVCRLLMVAGVATAINPLVVAAAAAFAALVGIFFGFYPARKASALYPIDALRYE